MACGVGTIVETGLRSPRGGVQSQDSTAAEGPYWLGGIDPVAAPDLERRTQRQELLVACCLCVPAQDFVAGRRRSKPDAVPQGHSVSVSRGCPRLPGRLWWSAHDLTESG